VGTTVTLTPAPAAGWHFDHWEGDLSGNANPASVVMDAAKTVTAVFLEDQFALTVLVTGQGTVTADPAGGPYAAGTTVTLTPVPAAGWHFDHWEGALAGSATPGLVVMDAPKTVTAVFAETLHALNVTITGGGTVTLTPDGGAYAPGTQVTLTATPDTGWHFDQWQGDLSGGATVTQVTMDAAKSVTAVFEREEYTLTVLSTGGGSVTLDPPGGTYPYETEVTLTPLPDAGNRFEIWGGELSGTGQPITITMTANRYVDAFFMPETYTLFSPNNFCAVGSTLYFLATGPYSGRELWRTDGTYEGTRLVRDISPGYNGPDISFLTNLNGTLHFFAANGSEYGLWTSDGTAEGTVWVTGLGGSTPALPPLRIGGTLYFSAVGVSGGELWATDGTAEGTRRVKIWGPETGYPGYNPGQLTDVGGVLYFNNTTQVDPQQMTLWRSDGTTDGTVPLAESVYMAEIAGLNGQALFAAGDALNYSLVVTDGTPEGTQALKTFDFGPGDFAVSGGLLYFGAEAMEDFNTHIWASDGASTYKVDGVSYRPWGLTDLNGTLLYIALYTDSESQVHCGLFATTGAGGALLAEINQTLFYGYGDYEAVVGNVLFFTAENSYGGVGIWKSDGTAPGTMMVSNLTDTAGGVSPSPYELTAMNGKLYFSAGDEAHGHQLWASDGTPGGTLPISCPTP
jgi:ELWxxDGT repeat protein